jgi:hypothetical protein
VKVLIDTARAAPPPQVNDRMDLDVPVAIHSSRRDLEEFMEQSDDEWTHHTVLHVMHCTLTVFFTKIAK